MIKNVILLSCFLLAYLCSPAQKPTSLRLERTATDSSVMIAAGITAQAIKTHLDVIASDEYEGRETGTEGQRKAANYIANHFKSSGIPPLEDGTYFQKVILTKQSWDNISLSVNGHSYKHLFDYYALPVFNPSMSKISVNEIIFLGYGIDAPAYSDYKGKNVKDKVILIYNGEPMDDEGVYHVTGTKEASSYSDDLAKKLEIAYTYGVKAVLLIDTDFKTSLGNYRRMINGRRMGFGDDSKYADKKANHFAISTEVAKKIMGRKMKKVIKARDKIKAKGKSKSLKIKAKIVLSQTKTIKRMESENVLGFIEGTDPERKDEIVVVTAHYDHLGTRGGGIYNGADDNGSGTSTVLNMAEVFAKAKGNGFGPKRSVLFMLVTGEEKGLLGSEYYTRFPVYPLENTIVNVNVDMIGRRDEVHKDSDNLYLCDRC